MRLGVRSGLLIAALASVSAALTLWLRQGGSIGARPELLGVLPVCVFLSGLFLGPRGPTHRGRAGLIAMILASWAIVVDSLFIPVGLSQRWLTLTFGDNRLLDHPLLTLAWALPACLLAGAAWEWTLRRRLHDALLTRSATLAVLVCSAVGLLLDVPSVLGTDTGPPLTFYTTAFAALIAFELSLSITYQKTGALWLTSSWRGAQLAVAIIGVQDWYGVTFPLANYTEADPRMYTLRIATALAAFVPVAIWASLSRGPR